MPQKQALAKLYSRPGFMIRRCHQLAESLFANECKEFNFTTSQCGVMHILTSHPGVDQITLAGLLGHDRSTTALIVAGLEKRGLLTRKISAKDKRKRLLYLTKEGETFLDKTIPKTQTAESRVIQALDTDEQEQFLRLLGKILNANDGKIRAPIIQIKSDS